MQQQGCNPACKNRRVVCCCDTSLRQLYLYLFIFFFTPSEIFLRYSRTHGLLYSLNSPRATDPRCNTGATAATMLALASDMQPCSLPHALLQLLRQRCLHCCSCCNSALPGLMRCTPHAFVAAVARCRRCCLLVAAVAARCRRCCSAACLVRCVPHALHEAALPALLQRCLPHAVAAAATML